MHRQIAYVILACFAIHCAGSAGQQGLGPTPPDSPDRADGGPERSSGMDASPGDASSPEASTAPMLAGTTPAADRVLRDFPSYRLLPSAAEILAWYANPAAEVVAFPLAQMPAGTIHHFGYVGKFNSRKQPGNEYAFLSNYYEITDNLGVVLHYNGLACRSVEACYQAQKFFGTPSYERFAALDANAARKMAHGKALMDGDAHMRAIVALKFMTIPSLGIRLLNTGSAMLIEETTAWGDGRWGMVRAVDKRTGQLHFLGENKLGKLLGQVRSELHAKATDDVRRSPGD